MTGVTVPPPRDRARHPHQQAHGALLSVRFRTRPWLPFLALG